MVVSLLLPWLLLPRLLLLWLLLLRVLLFRFFEADELVCANRTAVRMSADREQKISPEAAAQPRGRYRRDIDAQAAGTSHLFACREKPQVDPVALLTVEAAERVPAESHLRHITQSGLTGTF
jgi:hypothetical protein